MSRAFIVRHGNTFGPGEPPRRIGARTDLPLVESGRVQALALRDHFTGQGIVLASVLVSPLLRTRETAALIAPGLAIEPTDWLREIDHGPDEGRTEGEVVARIGADALARWDAHAEPPPGWNVDAEARLSAWRGFLSSPPTGDILLVTSNGAARYARLALGLPAAKLRTGAYGVVDFNPLPAMTGWDRRPAP